ncbi:MAG: hypothetical protein K2Q03_04185 [Sphingobacteriaceae bacterium]|nr:hypothetical protein [Sphingobacteriaceae bacterium]
MIKTITIKNIKGIEEKILELNIYPNKPSIVVAPNGFGKSSLAMAFSSLNRERLKLTKESFHKNEEESNWSLSLKIKDVENKELELIADNNQNQISKYFDVFVINNKLIAKTKQQSYDGKLVASSSIEVSPIALIPTVPEKHHIEYKYRDQQKKYDCGDMLPNIHELFLDYSFMSDLDSIDFKKFNGLKISRQLDLERKKISGIKGKKEDTRNNLSSRLTLYLEDNSLFSNLLKIIKNHSPHTDIVHLTYSALQIIDLFNLNNDSFKKAIKYSSYADEKKEYDELFSTIETTWKNIKPIEDSKKGLIVEFPKANQISNGERDFINFLSSLIAIKRKIKSEHCILIIDEVFDYLDDSNLITAQYYISRIMKDVKGKTQFYPIILTHLSPHYFKNYRFNKQQIVYLDKQSPKKNKEIEDIIKNRSKYEKEFKDIISKYYLHYDPSYENKDYKSEFSSNSLHHKYDTPKKFRENVFLELSNYINGNNCFDPISICAAVRLKIEEAVYNELKFESDQIEFINTFETDKKLQYISSKGIDFPETYSLLGVIYNEAMHLNIEEDKLTPICSKLNNLLIKKMIAEVVSE